MVRRRALLIATAVLFVVPTADITDSRAQEATAQRPADIRLGSCASLGDVVVPLVSVFIPEGEAQGQTGATPVEQSVTTVPMLLEDLLATGHAITVHASPEQVGTPIACGEIGGALAADGTLAVGLNAMNDSRISGAAYFVPSPAGEGTTVTLLLIDERAGRRGDGGNGVGGGTAPDEATATDASATGAPSAVDEAAGPDNAASTPGRPPAPAPATAGLDGTSSISATNADGKNAKPDRTKDKATAERDANGNAGTATTDSADTKSRDAERADREGGARAGEDGANG